MLHNEAVAMQEGSQDKQMLLVTLLSVATVKVKNLVCFHDREVAIVGFFFKQNPRLLVKRFIEHHFHE